MTVKTEDDAEEMDQNNVYGSNANGHISKLKIKRLGDKESDFNGLSSGTSSESSDEEFLKNFNSKAKESKSKTDNETNTASDGNTLTDRVLPATTSNQNNQSANEPTEPKMRRIRCRICKLKFTKDTIIPHLQSRHVPKINPRPRCDTCGNTFSNLSGLRSHQHLHSGRGRFICTYCGKEYTRNAMLKEHVNGQHTGEKPFVCQIANCKKAFHRESMLRSHHQTHTGERKFRCDIENCERAFMFRVDLKRHKFSAHGIYFKKFPCLICSKILPENRLLKRHLKTHDAH